MLSASVSNVNLYRIWMQEEDSGPEWITDLILHPMQTPKMKAGEAFHEALELALEGEKDSVYAKGYRFYFRSDWEIALPALREMSVAKVYDGLEVRGRVDGISGKILAELKTTEKFDADNYFDGLQWRFYLDMTGCEAFDWHVFCLKDLGNDEYDVWDYHRMRQFSYTGMHEDCLKWARAYKDFAIKVLEPAREREKALITP